TGAQSRRPLTMAATRLMAAASSTDVPPNFITIISLSSVKSTYRRLSSPRHPVKKISAGRGDSDDESIKFKLRALLVTISSSDSSCKVLTRGHSRASALVLCKEIWRCAGLGLMKTGEQG